MQSKCMLRVRDDDIETSYKIVPDIFLEGDGGCHGTCVTSYGLHLSAPPLLRAHMTSSSSSGEGLRNLLIG